MNIILSFSPAAARVLPARVILSGTQSQRLCVESNSKRSAGANRGENAVWDLGRCTFHILTWVSMNKILSLSPAGAPRCSHITVGQYGLSFMR